MSIGKNIAKYRKANGLTQEELGAKIGVTNQSVSKWESEVSMPDVMLLPEIANALNITLENLYGIEKAPEKTDTPPKKPKKTLRERLKALIPSKRRLIQLYSALLFNANIKGFIKGEIFMGASKNLCAPGINCYSCPGAVMACPLGALQAELNRANKSFAFYVVGILALYGIIAGRTICGWLCPFGFIQELLHKIKTPKLKKRR